MRAISPSSRMISQMTPAGLQPGEARQIDRGLGLAGAHQHAALRARAAETCGRDAPGRRRWIVGSMATRMVWARSAAEMPVVTPSRASMVTVNAVPKRDEFCCVMRKQTQMVGALFGEREADEAAPVAGHEVDGLGRDVLGGQREVALVLAVLVVDHDDHAAGADLLDRAGHVGERASMRSEGASVMSYCDLEACGKETKAGSPFIRLFQESSGSKKITCGQAKTPPEGGAFVDLQIEAGSTK